MMDRWKRHLEAWKNRPKGASGGYNMRVPNQLYEDSDLEGFLRQWKRNPFDGDGYIAPTRASYLLSFMKM